MMRLRVLAGGLIAGSAVVHVIHAAGHRDDPQLWWFFMVVAAVQFALAAGMIAGRNWALWAGVGLNSGLIGLYATSMLLPLPGIVVEPVETIALIAKFFEGTSIVAAALVLRARESIRPTVVAEASGLSRRQLLRAGSITAAGLVSGGVLSRVASAGTQEGHGLEADPSGHFGNAAVGTVDTSRFDPMVYLREFDRGKTSTLPDGRTLREFQISAIDVEIEVAPGVYFPAWAYNGKVPGPTIRATEGELVRIHFTNAGSHPHTMHFHGFHRAGMDGVFEVVQKGESFTYEFIAEPFGLHLYHCHTTPLKRHIHKGLYGVFIIDPPGGRPPADEMVMTMNAFDTNFDGENEIYAVNTVAHHYMRHPVEIGRGELVRIYLVNITEFDLLNSFHPHATFFHEYRTGTKLEPDNFTDTIILGQGERSILELTYKEPGDYVFHAHVSEFAELGWMGLFRVK